MRGEEQKTDLDSLFRVIGYTVTHWAMIEGTLDMSIAVVYHCCGGKDIEPKLPRTLKQKIQFMRKALRRLGSLAPLKSHGLDLMQQVSDMKRQRHDLVHSVITSVNAISGKFKFTSLDTKQAMHRIRETEFDINHFPKFSKEIQDLAVGMTAFAQKLAEDYAE